MTTFKDENPAPTRPLALAILRGAAVTSAIAATAISAVFIKEFGPVLVEPAAAVEPVATAAPLVLATSAPVVIPFEPITDDADADTGDAPSATETETETETETAAATAPDHIDPKWAELAKDPSVRWFNGRPVRPARTITMTVTAYSPDAISCGDSADGITATLHPVTTNGHALVAADPRVLPYGSIITVPGYDQDRIVPVLDCGGAIKGRRLDVLFPTHQQARKWGVQRLAVTVWQYADGQPADNPRKLR